MGLAVAVLHAEVDESLEWVGHTVKFEVFLSAVESVTDFRGVGVLLSCVETAAVAVGISGISDSGTLQSFS